jgi:DNA invertase Pin-like site-specific DNA recombinase
MARAACRIVGYLRTSTDDQVLGLEAQDATVRRIAAERGCELVRIFVEHESGGRNDRPELDRAIRHARRVGAMLVVAKLDRLARDTRFLLQLLDGDVPIVFGDLPEVDGSAASRLVVQIMASMAEFERRRIGERTREALAALKARGVVLGRPENLTAEAQSKGSRASARASRARAVADMADVAAIAGAMRGRGETLQAIADRLNAGGYPTRNGASWNRVQVKRVLDRARPTA